MTAQGHTVNVFDSTPIPPAIALPLIADRLKRLSADPMVSAGDYAILGILDDLTNVVAQLAGVTR